MLTCEVACAAADVGVVGTLMEAFGEWEAVVCYHEGAKQEARQNANREMHYDLLRYCQSVQEHNDSGQKHVLFNSAPRGGLVGEQAVYSTDATKRDVIRMVLRWQNQKDDRRGTSGGDDEGGTKGAIMINGIPASYHVWISTSSLAVSQESAKMSAK